MSDQTSTHLNNSACMHLLGVFIYGAIALITLFVLAIHQGSLGAAALAIVATAFAWLAQNFHTLEPSGSLKGNWTAVASAVTGICALLVILFTT